MAWFALLLGVLVGAAIVAVLARRMLANVDDTVQAFDDLRRDARLAVIELRVDNDRVARRIDQLKRPRQ
jgi:hypothetical protein